MRRNFAQILANSLIDIPKEYVKLTGILYRNPIEAYGNKTLYDEISKYFAWFRFRGTCLSLKEFDKQYGFEFPKVITAEEIDAFVSFCEYFYNLLTEYNRITNPSAYSNLPQVELYWTQIDRVMDSIGYMRSEMNGFTIYVARSAPAVAVAESELIPEEISYKVISYNHYSMKGNLQEKKNTILRLADLLEPKRKNSTR